MHSTLEQMNTLFGEIQDFEDEIQQFNQTVGNDDDYLYVEGVSEIITGSQNNGQLPNIQQITKYMRDDIAKLEESVWALTDRGDSTADMVSQLRERYANTYMPAVERYLYLVIISRAEAAGYDLSTLATYAAQV